MEKDLLNPKKIAEKRRMDIGESFLAYIHPAPQSPSRLAIVGPNAVIILNAPSLRVKRRSAATRTSNLPQIAAFSGAARRMARNDGQKKALLGQIRVLRQTAKMLPRLWVSGTDEADSDTP